MTLSTDSAAAPRWERRAVWAILLAFLIVELSAVRNLTFVGQDNYFHFQHAKKIFEHPTRLLDIEFMDRPLVYWIGAIGLWLTHDRYGFELASGINALLATVALGLVHDATRTFIRSPWLRLAALGTIAFLPVTLVTCVVYAADTTAMLPFALTAWSLAKCLAASDGRSAARFALLTGAALALGSLAKFTFIFLPFALLFVVAASARWKTISWRRAGLIVLIAASLPLLLNSAIYASKRAEMAKQSARHDMDWNGTNELSWRDLLSVKRTDARIFTAPIYWDTAQIDGQPVMPLLLHHGYSYPALLHLGVFTDVMNFTHGGYVNRTVARPAAQQTASSLATKLGVWLIAATMTGVLAFWATTLSSLLRPTSVPPLPLVVWATLGAVWFAPLVVTLPFVHGAYEFGYWLPRLILPALWSFVLTLFGMIDHASPPRWLAISLIALALFESVIHVRSVWY